MKTTTPGTRPTAVGYVSPRDHTDRARQSDALFDYAQAEGLRLVRTLLDGRGGWTISQLVELAGEHQAAVVLLPARVHLAEAAARLSADLGKQGARVVVVDVDDTTAGLAPGNGRPVARLAATLRRRETAPAPA
jgi:hypothetical protein